MAPSLSSVDRGLLLSHYRQKPTQRRDSYSIHPPANHPTKDTRNPTTTPRPARASECLSNEKWILPQPTTLGRPQLQPAWTPGPSNEELTDSPPPTRNRELRSAPC